jgi:hypothetical protein
MRLKERRLCDIMSLPMIGLDFFVPGVRDSHSTDLSTLCATSRGWAGVGLKHLGLPAGRTSDSV